MIINSNKTTFQKNGCEIGRLLRIRGNSVSVIGKSTLSLPKASVAEKAPITVSRILILGNPQLSIQSYE